MRLNSTRGKQLLPMKTTTVLRSLVPMSSLKGYACTQLIALSLAYPILTPPPPFILLVNIVHFAALNISHVFIRCHRFDMEPNQA